MTFHCQECGAEVTINIRTDGEYQVVLCECSSKPVPTNQEVIKTLKSMAKEKLEENNTEELSFGYAMGLTHAAWVLTNKE